jgi:phage FluMu protein Com
MGTIIVLALIVGAVYLVIKMANKSKTKDRAVTCPKCKTVNTFDAQPCGNCGSARTYREYQYSSDTTPYIQKCPDCQTTSAISTLCTNCGTDLRNLIQGGKGRAALLGAAGAVNSTRR